MSKQKEQLYQNFADNWSLIGYRYAYMEHGIRKVIWLILLLAGTAFAVYLFYGSIVGYLEYETYTVSNMDYDLEVLPFPTVTLCNFNSVHIQKAIKSGLFKTSKEYLEKYEELKEKGKIDEKGGNNGQHSKNKSAITKLFKRLNISSYQEAINLFEMNFKDLADHTISRAMETKPCVFNKRRCDIRREIKDTLSWGKLSLCQQFNPFVPGNASLNITGIGMDDGLTMLLNIDSENMLKSNFPYKGLQLIIHPYGTPHFMEQFNEVVPIQPGTMSIIRMELNQLVLLGPPYATACGSKAYKIIQHYPYTKAMCIVDCILQDIYEKCKCVGFEFDGLVGNVSICEVKNMGCYFHRRKVELARRSEMHACRRSCPRECVHYKYDVRTTQATLGNTEIYQKLKMSPKWKNKTQDQIINYIRENVVGFHIGFSALHQHIETVTPAVTWMSLLGEIGGNLGLFLGFSILTAFELFFFIYDFIILACSRKIIEEMKRESATNGNVDATHSQL